MGAKRKKSADAPSSSKTTRSAAASTATTTTMTTTTTTTTSATTTTSGGDENEIDLDNFHLRCSVKESHNKTIRDIVVNRTSRTFALLVAAIADKQATIYTMPEHSDVLVLFTLFENRGPVTASSASRSGGGGGAASDCTLAVGIGGSRGRRHVCSCPLAWPA